MQLSKKPIAKYTSYEDDWDDFASQIGELVKKRFKSEYCKVTGKNMGWRKRSGHKVFQVYRIDLDSYEVGRDFLNEFMPSGDYSAIVHSLNHGKGLFFRVTHHDNPVGGDEYYILPTTKGVYDRF